MGAFGHNPTFTVHGQLSYDTIKDLMEQPAHRRWERADNERNIYDGNSSNYAVRWNGHHHPVTGAYETAACMRLYRTDILQFFKDGALHVSSYNSGVTRDCINRMSRVRVHTRDGHAYFVDVDGERHPFDRDLDIAPDGTVLSVHTEYQTVTDPDLRKEYVAERAVIRKQWRESGAMNRLLLGEFGELMYRDAYGGTGISLPDSHPRRRELFQALCARKSYDEVMEVTGVTTEVGPTAFGRRRKSMDMSSYTSDVFAAQAIERLLLDAMYALVRRPTIHNKIEHTGMKVW